MVKHYILLKYKNHGLPAGSAKLIALLAKATVLASTNEFLFQISKKATA